MVFRTILFGFAAAVAQLAMGQWTSSGTNDTSSISFGVVKVGSSQSISLKYMHKPSFPISAPDNGIDSVKLTNSVFSTSFTSSPSDSATITISFLPATNLLYRGQLIVYTKVASSVINLSGQGRYAENIYVPTENLYGEALKSSLKSIVSTGSVMFSYNTARDYMYSQYDNHNDSVTCIYTGRKAKFNTRSGATAEGFNCEHTFPQGFFGGTGTAMGTDMHHLFPTDDGANNSRNNFPIGHATAPYQNISTNAPSKLGANNVYEPRDEQKPRTAAALLYFITRYGAATATVGGSGYATYGSFVAPYEDTLRAWIHRFGFSPADTVRNAAIFTLQKNRNPYVDHPEFLDRISSITGTAASLPVIRTLGLPATRPQELLSDYVQVNNNDEHVILPVLSTGNSTVTFSYKGVISGTSSLSVSGPDSIKGGSCGFFMVRYTGPAITANQVFNDTLLLFSNAANTPTLKVPFTWNIAGFAGIQKNISQQPRLFPNPAQNSLSMANPESGNYEIMISDLLGRPVMQFSLPGGATIRQDISSIPAGMYLVTSTADDRSTGTQYLQIIR